MKEVHELTIKVYEGSGKVDGYNKYQNKDMIYFLTDYTLWGMRGQSKNLAKEIVSQIEDNLKKNINLPYIKFEFPVEKKVVPSFIDWFFGRPKLCTGATFLKPLQERRKNSLINELNKIGTLEDRRGKTIELRA